MANPNSAFSDIIATTLQGYSGEMADNISNSNALLKQINAKGNKTVATGREIVQEMEYSENQNAQWYSGAQPFDIGATENFTAATFAYKQLVASATINGLEEIQNSGPEAVHNLMKARIRNVERTLRNMLGRGVYADGTGNGGLETGGVQFIVADVNTNTVGGVPASTEAWWRNYVYDFSTLGVTPGSGTIQHAMNLTDINTARGTDKCDLIMADQIYYLHYMESLQANQRFTDDKGAGAGFKNLMYGGRAPVIYDDVCPPSHMYFLNTDFLFLRPAKGREFKPLGERASVNQDAIAVPVVWAGNMTTNGRQFQGVICA